MTTRDILPDVPYITAIHIETIVSRELPAISRPANNASAPLNPLSLITIIITMARQRPAIA